MIQIIDLLEYLNLPYQTSGKNVSGGWVEIQCPFPYCSDPSNHLGINLESGYFHCWVCGEKGFIAKLVKTITNLSYSEANRIIAEFSDGTFLIEKQETEKIHSNIIPKEATIELPQLHIDYLKSRNFDPIKIQQQYKIMACYTAGPYAYRIIIPIIIDGEIVNFTGRDATGKQKNKYKNCPNSIAILPMKECLYNIDSVKDKVIICEGVTDVWRIGQGSIATMGVEYATAQLAILSRKDPKEIYILYDSDATKGAEKLASAVSTFCSKVEILELETGDPGDMTEEEVLKLRKEIGL